MSRALSLQKVDGRSPTPKYLQAREILIEAIRSGEFAPGCKLPSTSEISALFNISLITAHRALEGLVESGWLRREVGRGTYVRDDVKLNGRQRPLAIGLLFDTHVNIDDYYHSSLINGLRREARADEQPAEFFFHDRFELNKRGNKDICAICIHPPLERQAEVERLARQTPTVVLGGSFPNARVTCVDCDNQNGARLAVRHLLQLGHRRFMVLSGPTNLSNARDRAHGAIAELAAHGIELDERNRPESRDSVVLDEETRGFVEGRLAAPDRPTAIVAGGFYLALAAIQAVRRAGRQIPADVSIVGFDDPPSAPLLHPPLTTVRQPLDEMAARAYRLVHRAMGGRKRRPASCTLPTELLLRDSTGPAPETP